MSPSRGADKRDMRLRKVTLSTAAVLAIQCLVAGPALAYEWPKVLEVGDRGPEVKALQVRLAGWYPAKDQTQFGIDGSYAAATEVALMRFQAHYGLTVDGIAGPSTFEALERLQDGDNSTENFDFSEFWQNSNSSCSKEANQYAGTFKGGMTSEKQVIKNVRRLMWRLEALRAKLGDKPIAINSGFRSVAYNKCINGATYSQHMFGTAVDMRVVEVANRRGRNHAKRSQVSGIGCYSSLSHNHLDLRVENESLAGAQYWWWPERDEFGRDLSAESLPCYGEVKKAPSASGASVEGGGDLHLWSESELDRWKTEGEENLHGLD